ncbi:hypothetical protein IJG96_01135 [Candidatus Saccharibacteria bacterium]|nr:hypothetical protein [Candidatus Saccharibacteria bacterium]
MKTSDYVTVGFIAVFVTVVAYFLVNSLLGDPSEASVRFEYLESVSSSLATPDAEIFNVAAINPTVEVYIGSCEDTNLDGELDDDERRACGLDTLENERSSDDADYLEANGGLSNDENDAINSEQNYARGTTAEQRRAVEDSVNEYQQQQQTQNQSTQSAEDAAARRETVSGS